MKALATALLSLFVSDLYAHKDIVIFPAEYTMKFTYPQEAEVGLKLKQDSLDTLTLTVGNKKIEFQSPCMAKIKAPDISSMRLLWSGDRNKLSLEHEYFCVTFRYGEESDKRFGEYPEARFSYCDDGKTKLTIVVKSFDNSHQYRAEEVRSIVTQIQTVSH